MGGGGTGVSHACRYPSPATVTTAVRFGFLKTPKVELQASVYAPSCRCRQVSVKYEGPRTAAKMAEWVKAHPAVMLETPTHRDQSLESRSSCGLDLRTPTSDSH